MAQITVELDNDALFEALEEAQFSEPEKMRILQILFPHRGYNDKMRLVGEISVFINDNM
jgi:hypothetical protein